MLDSLPIDSSLHTLLEKAGRVYEIGGNTPFLLDDPSSVWYVLAGTVEVFTVRVFDGKASGMRNHFFTAASGDLLFGMDLDRLGQGLGFLCVGVVGTKVCKVPMQLIQELATDQRFTAQLARQIDTWVAGLSHGITKSIYPLPRVEKLIDPNQEIVLAEGEKARAHKTIVWVSYRAGNSLFIGMEEVALKQLDSLFPITTESWLQAITTTRLESIDTNRAIVQKGSWDGLDAFYDVLLKCEFFNTTLAAVDEYNRLKKKAERNQTAREESLEQLASIMVEGRREEPSADLDDVLFSACTAVGNAAGIRIVAPPRVKEGQQRRDLLGDIVKASRIRMRPVILSTGWWNQDNGPLLGYLQKENRPVALLPISSKNYELFDPSQRVKIIVTPAVAESLSENAVTLYRSFPAEPISFRNLLAFAGFGGWKDLRTVILMGLGMGLLGLITPMVTGVFSNVRMMPVNDLSKSSSETVLRPIAGSFK